MKTSYDPVVDALYVNFSAHTPVDSEEVAPGVVFDFDAENRLVGIEVLNAKARVATDTLVTAAE